MSSRPCRILFLKSTGRVAKALAAALLTTLVAAAPAFAETKDEDGDGQDDLWQVVYMNGGRVGYGHVATERRTDDEGNVTIVTDMLSHLVVNRFGQKLTMTIRQHTEEDEDGRLRMFRFVLDNPPLSNNTTTGRVDGDTLHLETEAGGKTTTSAVDWDSDSKSPAWQDRQLSEDPLEEGEERSFEMFDPSVNQTVTITLIGRGPAETELLDGKTVTADKVTIKNSLIPALVITSYVDDEGDVVKTETNLLNTVTYAVDKETALEELGGEPVDLAVATLIRVKPIQRAYESKEIVYRIDVAGGSAAEHFAEGDTQSIRKTSDDQIELTVKSLKPADANAEGETADPVYLKATRFLECTDPRVAEHAAEAAGNKTDPVEIAVAMEKYVHTQMKNKNYETGLATAAEVAKSLAGDCTEHSVLLTAMLRAAEIPSRVVVGLVYADKISGFAGHMWTEAFLNGQWVPLDATLGRGGVGAAHIKVTDSSLDEDAPNPVSAFLPMLHLLGQMKIEVVSVK